MKHIGLTAIVAVSAVFTANAGGLSNGTWSATGCGRIPELPAIDATSASTYNRSVEQVNEWQKQIQIYHDCVIREANSDIAAINQAATAEQAKINQASGSLNADLNRGRDKLESSPMPTPRVPPGGAGMQGYPQY